MIKLLLIIWLFCGIFAILCLFIETWRYANDKLVDYVHWYQHLVIILEVLTISHLFHLIVIVAMGPIGWWITRTGVAEAKKDFNQLLDDNEN